MVHPSGVKSIERSKLLDAENSVRLQHDRDSETSFLLDTLKTMNNTVCSRYATTRQRPVTTGSSI
ncbi:hypothetical protein RE6C_00997 [Rhodopirellula europaea 6C]|uniref:Uncharacterized protein n=1 Tax=Rhodopirellula europaea 6C TaxID=1263867 RepID=M2AZZ8_9BACT|nr:hypothetical protein RE6C_00997 [Rhodopirellula europaea 6C]